MSKGKWISKEPVKPHAPVEPRTVQVLASPDVKEMIEATDLALSTAYKDQPVHRAIILCLNLLLTTARYGRTPRESEQDIVAAIASLE